MILLTLLVFILLSLSAIFSASETALFSLSALKIKTYKQNNNPKKRLVSKLLTTPGELLTTILIVNVAATILIQNILASMFENKFNWILNVGIPLAITLILGEIIPKSIGLVYNTKIAYRVAPLITIFQKTLLPLRKILAAATNYLCRILFFFLKKEQKISIDELRHALQASYKQGFLHKEETELIQGYLTLQDSTVKELMCPREDVLFFDINDSISKLMHLFIDEECSRIPVCNNTFDELLGIMTSRLFFIHKEKIQTSNDLLSVLEKPFFIPETVSAKNLLRQFYSRKNSFAIVVDEYRSISGIVSLEDLVETVIGEIVDRRDEKSLYIHSGKDTIIAHGKMEISEINKILNLSLESQNNMITISGFLIEQLGDIPKTGTKYSTPDCLFRILSADHTKIRRIYIQKLRKAP
jgi:putative hemolysin